MSKSNFSVYDHQNPLWSDGCDRLMNFKLSTIYLVSDSIYLFSSLEWLPFQQVYWDGCYQSPERRMASFLSQAIGAILVWQVFTATCTARNMGWARGFGHKSEIRVSSDISHPCPRQDKDLNLLITGIRIFGSYTTKPLPPPEYLGHLLLIFQLLQVGFCLVWRLDYGVAGSSAHGWFII